MSGKSKKYDEYKHDHDVLNYWKLTGKIVYLIFIFFFFLVSIELISEAFGLFGKDAAEEIIKVTTNPFIGLFVGLLTTAIIQSSSTTTSMIVAMVASGALTVTNAVPMIMGANIGTSVTSTFVALGHIANKDEFKRGFAAGTVHDFFNILCTIIIFPMELSFGLLSNTAHYLTSIMHIGEAAAQGGSSMTFMGMTVKPTTEFIMSLVIENGWVVLLLGIVLLFVTLHQLSDLLKKLLIGKSQDKLDKVVFGSPTKSLFWGLGLTAAVQSSSVTTSMSVPLVATGKVSLKKVFPFLLGANIGTTVTALIASISKSQEAVTIAFCHTLFNAIGVVIFMTVPYLKNWPINIAEGLSNLVYKNRMWGFAYIVTVFFIIPGVLIYFTAF